MLIRHARHADVGFRLSGRAPGHHLTSEGIDQARRLAASLVYEPIARVEAGPLERVQATAAAIADMAQLPVETAIALDEVDFGIWTGQAFDELADDPDWRDWNACRSTATVPQGETMAAAQARAMAHVRALAETDQTVAIVSHCDIIRSVLAGVLGLSLDHILRFDIDPASVSRVAIDGDRLRVVSINERLV